MSVWVLYLEEHPFFSMFLKTMFSAPTFQMAEIHHIINGIDPINTY